MGKPKQVDCKLAKPRNTTSPNFKAFSVQHTNNSLDGTDVNEQSQQRKQSKPESKQSGLFSHKTSLHYVPVNQYTSYFSLSNTFRDDKCVSYSDKLSRLVHRFSQQLPESNIEREALKHHMKRFSLEDHEQALDAFKRRPK